MSIAKHLAMLAILSGLAFGSAVEAQAQAQAQAPARVIAPTDISNEPDEEESLVMGVRFFRISVSACRELRLLYGGRHQERFDEALSGDEALNTR